MRIYTLRFGIQKIKYHFLWCVSLRLYIDIWLKSRVGLLYCVSFPFYQSSIGPNTRSTFCVFFVSHETIRKQPLLNPLLWVGDPLSEMVKMGLLYAWACVRVRLLWMDYLGIKQNQSSCIISWGYCMPEICVRISLIWVDYLGMGWWTGSWIKTKFFIISWGIVCLDLCQNQFDLGRLSWNSS